MEPYYWATDICHVNNYDTMNDFIENHLTENFNVIFEDGTACEIEDENGKQYRCHASGNGDFRTHKVTFEEL